ISSNQSKFIAKRCMQIMSILNHENIDVGLVGVQSHLDDKTISQMLPINQSVMRRIPTHHTHV
ncbi:hypothetical protein RYX36_031375, partial [Vicia faba]